MATITQAYARSHDNAGIRARRVIDVQGPASYTTGGDPLEPGEVFLGEIEYFPSVIALESGAAPRLVVYDHINHKLLWFVPNTAAEVSGSTDLSGYSFRVEVIGKG
jgi:hypothetical protein